MTSIATDFENELARFRTEHQAAIQFFYAWQSIYLVAENDKVAARLLNEAPLMWNTILGALQTSALIALGRIFDRDKKSHSLDRLLSLSSGNLAIFSKEEFAVRKRAQSELSALELKTYMDSVYVATPEDFRRLRLHVDKRRRIYKEKYAPLRHKVFAHREMLDKSQVGELFAKTNIKEMQQLLTFLASLHEALWQLFFNGIKPSLRPTRFSAKRMLKQPSVKGRRGSVQERLISETQAFLTAHRRLRA